MYTKADVALCIAAYIVPGFRSCLQALISDKSPKNVSVEIVYLKKKLVFPLTLSHMSLTVLGKRLLGEEGEEEEGEEEEGEGEGEGEGGERSYQLVAEIPKSVYMYCTS